MRSASSGRSGLCRGSSQERRIALSTPSFHREDFVRFPFDRSNESTAKPGSDNARIAISGTSSTPRPGKPILPSCALAERLFRRRGRNPKDATTSLIAARNVIPDRTAHRRDRRHCSRQPAGRRRVSHSFRSARPTTPRLAHREPRRDHRAACEKRRARRSRRLGLPNLKRGNPSAARFRGRRAGPARHAFPAQLLVRRQGGIR